MRHGAGALFFWTLALAASAIHLDVLSANYSVSVRELFYHNFLQKCSKYPFVARYIDQLSRPHKRFILFTYHRKRLRNGGFGDRLGGLVTAFSYAVKYNRTLILKQSNGLAKLFKPFHPSDLGKTDEDSEFNWGNWRQWSNFSTSTAAVHNLEDCVSNEQAGFSANQTLRCAMARGDVPDQVVKFSSNRAYLCLWANKKSLRTSRGALLPAYQDTIDGLGLSSNDDIFEAAGCMLRLVLWPTGLLWDLTDEAYGSMTAPLLRDIKQTIHTGDAVATDLLQQAEVVVSRGYTKMVPRPYQIGLHFRCGDIHSYRGLRLHSDDYDRATCLYDEQKDTNVVNFESIGKSRNLNAGHPFSIGQCAAFLVGKYRQAWRENHSARPETPLGQSDVRVDLVGQVISGGDRNVLDEAANFAMQAPMISVVSTSDNYAAALQMQTNTRHSWTMVAPHGCHIELDDSRACYRLTAVYWFVLALSDKLVVQTFGAMNAPTSAFSRFAAMYGLSNTAPIHSGRYCGDEEIKSRQLGREHQGNWFCN